MTAAPKLTPDRSGCRDAAMRRPGPNAGKANVLGEATGACTLGAAGVGVQTRREGSAEITSGRACAQQRLAASCKDQPCEAMPKPDGGQQVWRMSPYERRRRGNALPGGTSCLHRGGNAIAVQRGSGSRQVKPRKGGNPTTLDRNLSSESRGLNSLPVTPNQQLEASLACEYGNVLLEA
jgi:putative hemolysin